KWPHLARLMKDEKIGIPAVGEIHLTQTQVDQIEGKRLKIFNSINPETPNKGGIAIVLNRNTTNIDGISIRRLIQGHAILAKIPWHSDLTITVLAIYAPAESTAANKAFWIELK
ncbi:hypothetical protein C8F01DRAFT_932416, partial [Mycena amicta]